MVRILIVALVFVSLVARAGAPWPIQASSDGRYLVDQTNGPAFFQGMAAWHFFYGISTNTAVAMLDTLKTNGFNALQTRLLDDWGQCDSNVNDRTEDFYGVSPFTVPFHFGNINTNYFENKRNMANWAAERGFMLFCAPLYLGYAGASQGFYDEVITNALSDVTNYGRFIGDYFKDCSNIVWMVNGDQTPPGLAAEEIDALAEGILLEDTSKLITEHVSGGAVKYAGNKSWLTLNAIYSSSPYETSRDQWTSNQFKPMYLTESHYEGDGSSPTELVMREQPYFGVLGGCLGGQIMGNQLFCEGRTGWHTSYVTAASSKQPYVSMLFTNREWWKLRPDTNDAVAIGKGVDDGDSGYNAFAKAADASFVIGYMPDGDTIEIRMTNIVSSSNQVTCQWYNPRAGGYTAIGTYTNTGTREFTPPDGDDWVLVLTGTSDGEEPPAATTNYYRAYMQGKIEMSGKAVLQ